MTTLQDIAKMVGVSVSTVSRTLSNDNTLSIPSSRKHEIKKVAKELNYKRYKYNNNTKKIAIVSWYDFHQEISDPYYYYIREGAYEMLKSSEYEILTYFKNDIIPDTEDIEAIVAIGKFSESQIQNFELFTSNIVFVDSAPNSSNFSCIQVDFKDVIRLISEYITKNKINDIGYIGGCEILDNGEVIIDKRYNFFKIEMEKLNLYNQDYFKIGNFSIEFGIAAIEEFHRNNAMPKFIFCANDHIALGCIRALSILKYNIPNDVEIIGFNNIPFAKYSYPSLSTIKVDQKLMGQEAAKIVLGYLKNEDLFSRKIYLPATIILRESTKHI